MVREIVKQAKERAIHLPKGMKQNIMNDVRGQNVSRETQTILKQKITEKTNGTLLPSDIKFMEK